KRWRLREDLVRMVRFAPLNLTADAFPSPGPEGATLDLLVCRNVTIYFSQEATRRLYARFVEVLAPDGWLLLGPSDPVPDHPRLLAPVYLPGAVLWRRVDARPHTARPRGTQRSGDRRPSAGRQPSAARTREARQTRTEAEPLVSDRPLDGAAYTSQGMLDLERGAVEEAIENLRRATFLAPQDALAQF